jgi:small nuclear ribonucleoprotein (snRNP)-like protein
MTDPSNDHGAVSLAELVGHPVEVAATGSLACASVTGVLKGVDGNMNVLVGQARLGGAFAHSGPVPWVLVNGANVKYFGTPVQG